ncbi:MAG TPA: MamI family restriction endonuclease [Candidatus Saccharibacteria bacterium]|nr:MamI family restriction endonuclease [Candidatus Saccharibacteria bacterium]
MQPQKNKVVIDKNKERIEELLFDLVLNPRLSLIKWSSITRQTPNIKIGYPGQHLASLITGVEGDRSGARGHDLRDGTEVKSCSRIDQLDKCNSCGYPVARLENECSNCSSENIKRNNDSKWLFTVRTPEELSQLTSGLERVLLMIGDYPNFDSGDYETLRFQAFEIWPKNPRNARFAEIISNYYEKIYLGHKQKNPNSNPAPKNFWPYQYQFYMCNPIKTFSCTVKNSETTPEIEIDYFFEPGESRENLDSEIMPAEILTKDEFDFVINAAKDAELQKVINNQLPASEFRGLGRDDQLRNIRGIDESLRSYLPLRDTDKISTAKNTYSRRQII